ncbi:hypothetical protein D3C73_743930 [compost metagenome]
MPGDVAGHQVRGELDARELAAKTTSQGAHQQGLAQPRHAFEQHMAASDQGVEDVVDNRVLADDHFLQLRPDCLGQLNGAQALLLGVARRTGLDLFTHKAFLKVCKWATWRLNSTLDSRCLPRGPMAWLMARVGWPVRRASTSHCSATPSCSKPG